MHVWQPFSRRISSILLSGVCTLFLRISNIVLPRACALFLRIGTIVLPRACTLFLRISCVALRPQIAFQRPPAFS